MGETNFFLLSLVGLVALVAIFGLYTNRPLEIISEEPLVQSAPSGNVRLEGTTRIDISEGEHDFNFDGFLSSEDSTLLAQWIDSDSCPENVDCDVDNNGVLDYNDLSLFNTHLRPIAPPPLVTETVRTRSVGKYLA